MKTILRLSFLFVGLTLFSHNSTGQQYPTKPNAIAGANYSAIARDLIPLYGQLNNPSGSGTNSQMYPDNPTYTCQAADDFIVPTDQTWFVESFEFPGFYSNGAGPVTMANLFIYANDGGTNSPGATIVQFLQSPVTVNDGQIFFDLAEPLVLSSGHYWISVQPIMPFVPNGQWFWRRQLAPTLGNEFHWQNPGGGFGYQNTLTWEKASLINFGTVSNDYNLSFAIYGEVEFTLTLPAGWSGISSFAIPTDANLESMFEPLIDDLIILYNDNGMYWPDQVINTLIDWNPNAGYVIKMDAEASMTFKGQLNTEKSVMLPAGQTILHIPTGCGISTDELLEQLGGGLVYVHEIATTNVFIPEYSIDNLQFLAPGKAFYIQTMQELTLTFPDCGFPQE
jgi:hypothetical protein